MTSMLKPPSAAHKPVGSRRRSPFSKRSLMGPIVRSAGAPHEHGAAGGHSSARGDLR
jgi:hypothetical protein